MHDFDFSFGIEEEFFLSCATTGELVRNGASALLAELDGELGDAVTSEMLQSQVEIASPVFRHVEEASLIMPALRRSLAEAADSLGYGIVAAGTHPFGAWRNQLVTEQPRYERLMADFRIIGHRNLVCGLHIHVALPPTVDRVDIMNRTMRWLPLFLAFSTSSPFWDGQATGLLSYRQALYDEWPRSGIPDYFEDEDDYRAFVTRMVGAGAIRDASQLWWTIRPAARFPTLELRIADVCTRVEDSVALAALFRCLVAALVREPALGARRTTHTRRIVDENRWRAKRDGTRAQFIAEACSDVVSVADVFWDLMDKVGTQAERLECTRALQPLANVLEHGTSAHRQLSIYNDRLAAGDSPTRALGQVLSWLQRTTAPRQPLTGPPAACRRPPHH